MNNFKKQFYLRNLPILLITVVLVAAGVVVYEFSVKNKNITQYSAEQKSQLNSVNLSEYKNLDLGFSLMLPESYKTSQIEEGLGSAVLVKGENFEMQIFVSDYDEQVDLTERIIKENIPDLQMEEVKETKVSETQAVNFITNENGKKFRQVWMVKNRNIYQVTAPMENDEKVMRILQAWKWL